MDPAQKSLPPEAGPPPAPEAPRLDANRDRLRSQIFWSLLMAAVVVPPLWFAGRLLIGFSCIYFGWLVAERRDASIEIDLILLALACALAITGAVARHGLKRGWYRRKTPPSASDSPGGRPMTRAMLVAALAAALVWVIQAVYLNTTLWWWWERFSGIDRDIVTALDVAALFSVAGGVAWLDFRYGWNDRQWLRLGTAVGLVFVGGILMTIHRARQQSEDKAVLSNLRGLSAGADQYYLEYGTTIAAFGDLVGPLKYTKALNTVAGEVYPAYYTQGMTITVTGVAGLRTVTYAP